MSYAERTANLPQQPDGIEEDSHDLPDPMKAAKRAHEFLCEFGDGIVDAANGKALYARDLEVLSKSPALVAAANSAAADMLKAQADAIRKSTGPFMAADLSAYVQGIEYAVDRLRGVPQTEAAVTL
jgi:hypothetical protein